MLHHNRDFYNLSPRENRLVFAVGSSRGGSSRGSSKGSASKGASKLSSSSRGVTFQGGAYLASRRAGGTGYVSPGGGAPKPGTTRTAGGRTQTYVESSVKPGTFYWQTGGTQAQRLADVKARGEAVKALGRTAADIGTAATEKNVSAYLALPEKERAAFARKAMKTAAAGKAAPEVYTGKEPKETEAAPEVYQAEEETAEVEAPPEPAIAAAEAPTAEDISYAFDQSLREGTLTNPFQKGSEAFNVYEEMKGILGPLQKRTEESVERREKEREKGKEFIESESQLKQEILGRRLTQGEERRQAGIEKIRARSRLAEKTLEEGRKKALRYLRGALAQRGALGTTGTAAFNVSALTAQYDIKNTELQQQASEQIQDLETKFEDISSQIQENQLLTESEKTKLMLELDRNTDNAIDSLMTSLANQEVQLSGQAFSVARQDQREREAREREKKRELRDYFLRRVEAGEFVDPEDMSSITEGDPTLRRLASLTQKTGRENMSKAVTNVYVNMLGADWTTKTNPATGNTYKDDATNEVVRLVEKQGWKLEDALNRVRSAIASSPEFKKLQAAKFAVKTTGSGTGGQVTSAIYDIATLGGTKYTGASKTKSGQFLDSGGNLIPAGKLEGATFTPKSSSLFGFEP